MHYKLKPVPIKELTIFLGRGITPLYTEGEGIIVLNQKCIREGKIDLCVARTHDLRNRAIGNEKLARNFDVLVNSTGAGTLGRVAQFFNEKPVTVDSHITIVRADPSKINPHYFGFVMRLCQARIEALAEGSTGQTELSRVALGNLVVEIIDDVEVQNRIAAILSTFDHKIWLNDIINPTVESMAQILFKSWFVDFDPVRAKVSAITNGLDPQISAMRVISGKTTAELQQLPPEQFENIASIADLFPARLEESEDGEIPVGWHWSAIGDEVEVKGGGTPSTRIPEYWNNGQNWWVTPRDMSGLKDRVLLKTERKITDVGVTQISSGVLPVDTVLLSSRAPVGYLAISKIPVSINQGFIAMICSKTLTPEYILQWAHHSMEEIISRASGTTFLEISKRNFTPIKVVVPEKNVLTRYSDQIRTQYNLIASNIRSNTQLYQIRDDLQFQLLKGNLLMKN
jgi:type I restriction enzyme S subunit